MTTNSISILFRTDKLLIVEREGEPYVPMRPIVEAMGLTWQGQHVKLTEGRWSSTITEIVTVGADLKQRPMTCLPLRKIAGWLMTISPNKVRPSLREKVIAYQNECDDVLWEHWSGRKTKAWTQVEKTWFGRRPHWPRIRDLALDGLTYKDIACQVQRSAGSISRCVRRMIQVGLIDPAQLFRARYFPATAERLISTRQLCLDWGNGAQS